MAKVKIEKFKGLSRKIKGPWKKKIIDLYNEVYQLEKSSTNEDYLEKKRLVDQKITSLERELSKAPLPDEDIKEINLFLAQASTVPPPSDKDDSADTERPNGKGKN